MRLGVLDVGSNTVHLLVVDAHRGGQPDPVRSYKDELRLAELLGADGALGPEGTARLVATVEHARTEAEQEGVEDLVAFATSAVRDATDSAQVLSAVRLRTGVDLQVLPGEDEARLTFLAVRRWSGWSAGRLLCLDIGGGSLEIGAGLHEEPDVAVSVPLGAGRVTRERLPGDPPSRKAVAALREHCREVLADVVPQVLADGRPDRVVVTSKTFRTLARLEGAAPAGEGPFVHRELTRSGLERTVAKVASLEDDERTRLPAVSPGRARQLLGGAVVAEEALRAFGVDRAQVCPWALREGVILRRLDWLAGA